MVMLARLNIAQKGLCVVAGLLAIELFIVVVLMLQLNALSQSIVKERHTVKIINTSSFYFFYTQRYIGDFFIAAFTPKNFLETDQSYNTFLPFMHRELDHLRKLVAEDRSALDQISEIEKQEARFRDYAEVLMTYNKKGPRPDEYAKLFDLYRPIFPSLYQLQRRYQELEK